MTSYANNNKQFNSKSSFNKNFPKAPPAYTKPKFVSPQGKVRNCFITTPDTGREGQFTTEPTYKVDLEIPLIGAEDLVNQIEAFYKQQVASAEASGAVIEPRKFSPYSADQASGTAKFKFKITEKQLPARNVDGALEIVAPRAIKTDTKEVLPFNPPNGSQAVVYFDLKFYNFKTSGSGVTLVLRGVEVLDLPTREEAGQKAPKNTSTYTSPSTTDLGGFLGGKTNDNEDIGNFTSAHPELDDDISNLF